MSALLLPISVFIKNFIELPISYLRELPIYFYLLLIIISIIIGTKIKLKRLFNTKVFICIAIVLGFQLLAMLISYGYIGNDSLNINPIKQFIKLCIFLTCIFIHYFVVKLLINNMQDVRGFIRGNIISLFIVLAISYIQLLYVIFPGLFDGFVSIIGLFENRFDRSWYDNGSYVQTMERINGLNPEAGYLAAQLLIVFVPFILASIKNKVNIFSGSKRYKPTFFYLLLTSIVIILFFAKTTTGLVAILMIFAFFWMSLPLKRKVTTAIMFVILGSIGIVYCLSNSYMMEILNENLFNKAQSGSAMNRSGGTIGLIIIWLKHLITGIGWDYHNFYLFENVPLWSTGNWEYHNVYLTENFYPILSIFFGWLAEFGTVCMIFIILYLNKLLKDYRLLSKQAISINHENCQMIIAIKDAAHFFVYFYIIISFLSFGWSESFYLIMFFFFIVVRQLLKDELSKESNLIEYKSYCSNT